MDDDKRSTELDLQEKRINDLWAKIEAREPKESGLDKKIEDLRPTVNAFDEKVKALNADNDQATTNAKALEEAFAKKIADLEENLKPFNNLLAEIRTTYEDYFSKPDPTIKSKVEKLAEHHSTIEKFEQSSSAMKKEIEEFRDFIYGNEDAKILGFKKEAAQLVESNKATMETWNKNYVALQGQIEGLLPGATSTGLAKAFQDQKNTYTLFIWLWSAIFVVSVVGMMAFGIYFFKADSKLTFEDTLTHILSRLPFFLPAVWLAVFAGKKQNQNTRLQQEYSHKESLAKSYDGHKREIDKLPDSPQKIEMLTSHLATMVEMLRFNPSQTLEHKSHEEKGPIDGFFSRIFPGKKE